MNGAALPSMIGTSGEFSSIEHVVDAHADERRQQMLDRLDRHFVARQPGRELNPGQVLHGRRHLVVAEVGPAEPDAEIGRRRLQRKVDLVAGVKTDSDTGNLATKCALCVH